VLDVARLAGGNGSPAADTLSWDQEAELAANPGLLGCFYLLINGRRPVRSCGDQRSCKERARHSSAIAVVNNETEPLLRDFQSCKLKLTTSPSQPSHQKERDDDDQHQS
jgi:hypothetical protein